MLTDDLSVEQQRELHRLCLKFEDDLLSNRPPGPDEWLVNCGSLPAMTVLKEFVAIRSEYRGSSPNGTCVADATMSEWQASCLDLLPEHCDEIRAIFKAAPMAPIEDDANAGGVLESRLTDKRYRFVKEIDRGGSGAVWLVYDKHLRRETAVKVLLRSSGDVDSELRLRQEARLCGRLSHPGIVPVYELDHFDDGRPFISMKLIRGETLAQRLKSEQSGEQSADPMSYMPVFLQVCEAVGYAHSQQVIHRDLKPANIMVGEFGEVQVMDWGLGKDLSQPTDETLVASRGAGATASDTATGLLENTRPQTIAGAVFGTLAYMPPEQTKGDPDLIDKRSDVFSLGSILCELLSGKPAYAASDVQGLLKQASLADRDDAFERLDASGQPAEFVQLAKECLKVDPAARPQDANELAMRLGKLIRKRSTRKRTLIVSTLSMTAAGAIVLAIMFALRPADTEAIKARVAEVDRVETLVRDADRHLREGKFKTALDEIRIARKLDDQPQLVLREANLLRSVEQDGKAEQVLMRGLSLWPNDRDLHALRVDILREQGDLAKAHQASQRGKKRFDLKPGVTRELAMQLLLAQRWEEALSYLNLVDELPNDNKLRLKFVTALIRANRCHQALQLADAAVGQEPENPVALMARAQASFELADYGDVARYLDQWKDRVETSDRDPKDRAFVRIMSRIPRIHSELQGNRFGTGKTRTADLVAAAKVAKHVYQRGDYERALRFYRQVLSREHNLPFISRRQWVLYVICIPLLQGDVAGESGDAFQLTLETLEQQLKDTTRGLESDKPRQRLQYLYQLNHFDELTGLRPNNAALKLTAGQREQLVEFWNKSEQAESEHIPASDRHTFESLLRKFERGRDQRRYIRRMTQSTEN